MPGKTEPAACRHSLPIKLVRIGLDRMDQHWEKILALAPILVSKIGKIRIRRQQFLSFWTCQNLGKITNAGIFIFNCSDQSLSFWSLATT